MCANAAFWGNVHVAYWSPVAGIQLIEFDKIQGPLCLVVECNMIPLLFNLLIHQMLDSSCKFEVAHPRGVHVHTAEWPITM